jgi:hypothetical protein
MTPVRARLFIRVDRGMALQYGGDDAPLHPNALAVDDANLLQTSTRRLPQVLGNNLGNIARPESVQIQRIFNREVVRLRIPLCPTGFAHLRRFFPAVIWMTILVSAFLQHV